MTDTENEEQAGAVTLEEAADFARVGAMVGDTPGTVTEPEPEAPRMDATESMAGFLSLVGAGAGLVGWKHTGAALGESAQKIAAAAVPVLRKYPWGARVLDFFERGSGAEEVLLLGALIPLAGAVRQDMASPEPERAKPASLPAEKTNTVDAPADLGQLVEVHGHAN